MQTSCSTAKTIVLIAFLFCVSCGSKGVGPDVLKIHGETVPRIIVYDCSGNAIRRWHDVKDVWIIEGGMSFMDSHGENHIVMGTVIYDEVTRISKKDKKPITEKQEKE
jgi:hypothetical protein